MLERASRRGRPVIRGNVEKSTPRSMPRDCGKVSLETKSPGMLKKTPSYARSSFPRFSLVFQVQRSVTSLMTLLSTQYKTPRHPSLQIEPIHRILIPWVILSEPTPSFTCTHCFKFVSQCLQLWVSTRRQSCSMHPRFSFLREKFIEILRNYRNLSV